VAEATAVSTALQKLEALKRVAKQARAPQDQEAWLNVSFFQNEQYAEWADTSQNIRELPWRDDVPKAQQLPRPTINKIMHFVEQNVAFALQSKPTADVLPATDDPMALSDAGVGNAYIQWLTDPTVENWERKLEDATRWALTANAGYHKWTYDPAKKRPVIKFVPSTDLYADPYPRDFYDARWVIHSQFLDAEQVYDVWGVEVKPDSVEKADLEKTAFMRHLGQSPVMQGVTVNEMWHKPSRRYPDGLYAVWAAGQFLVAPTKFPYDALRKEGMLPFTQIGAIQVPNTQHYFSPVTYLRVPQIELNRYHAQRIMTRQAWANLKLWLPEEVTMDQEWDNSPNQVLTGSSPTGARPEIIGPPGAMPDNNDGEWLRDEMQNVVGLHEVSQGQVPGRVEAAKAIELLKESDTSRLATLQRTTGQAMSRGFWIALMLARQYVSEEVILATYSKEGVAEVKKFKTDAFDPGMRIKITQGSGLAYSRAARLDQLTTLWTNGILRDPEAFAELADIPTPQIITTKAYDVRLARNENLTMADGTAVQANSWDDHTIHLREHNNFRKTSDFHSLPADAKTRFEFHCQQHEKLELDALQKDAQKAQLLAQANGQVPPTPPGGDSGGDGGTYYMDPQQGPGSNGAERPDTLSESTFGGA
jgi:hypothetical protein